MNGRTALIKKAALVANLHGRATAGTHATLCAALDPLGAGPRDEGPANRTARTRIADRVARLGLRGRGSWQTRDVHLRPF